MIKKISILLIVLVVVFFVTQQVTSFGKKDQEPVYFELQSMDGKTYSMDDFKGKIIVANFWATWCPPCRAEMPAFNRAYAKLKERDIVFIAFNIGEKKEVIEKFLKTTKIDFPIMLDMSSSTFRAWGGQGLPTTFFIDKDGKIVKKITGQREWDSPQWLKKIVSVGKISLDDLVK
ncbi:MAG: TlpA family protein disulfide reductase [Gammaproteobacteria bacterium]|nr:MAG: TlpA family protein disulfide reductase [Gammaproteobacteria bacterium]